MHKILVLVVLSAVLAACARFSSQPSSEEPQRFGHVVLQVADLQQSVRFYQNALNLTLRERAAAEGRERVFLSGTSEHHELVLMEAESPRDIQREERYLQQLAFEVQSRQLLADYYQKLTRQGFSVELADNRIAWSIYLFDPDNNKIELFWDIRKEPFGEPYWRGEQRPLSPEQLLQD